LFIYLSEFGDRGLQPASNRPTGRKICFKPAVNRMTIPPKPFQRTHPILIMTSSGIFTAQGISAASGLTLKTALSSYPLQPPISGEIANNEMVDDNPG